MSLELLEPTGQELPDQKLPPPAAADPARGAIRGESLAAGVLILLTLAVVQRGVGFVRSVLFCLWLDADQLGLWDMAFGFLVLAAPLAVLSLPGVFGRYYEHFQRRGQLRSLLRQTGAACLVLAAIFLGLLCLWPAQFAAWVFGGADEKELILWCAAALAAFIVYNYLTNLFTAMCAMRLVAALDLANSLIFAGVGLGLLALKPPSAKSVVIAYGAACGVCSLFALVPLARTWRAAPVARHPMHRGAVWTKIAPMAAWIVVQNLAANLFSIADRYVIVHFAPGSAEDKLAMVGQYHSARLIPTLLASIAALLAAMLLPHLTRDWEAGRRGEVARRLTLFLKLAACGFTAASVAILVAAPLVFHGAMGQKYAAGYAAMPGALAFSIWFGLGMIAQQYLWCAERASGACLAMLLGLAVNVAANIAMLPTLGLQGAVLAASIANLAALFAVFALGRPLGFHADKGLWLLLALPAAIPLGVVPAALAVAAAAALTLGTAWVFTRDEKALILRQSQAILARLPRAWHS